MSMYEALDKICEICMPPQLPLGQMRHEDWLNEFSGLGTRLPEQLLQLDTRFGTGTFTSIDRPHNASFIINCGGVSGSAISNLAYLRSTKRRYPKAFDIPLYFEDGGLLPIGQISHEIMICFRAIGDNPDRWKISLVRTSTRKVDHLDYGLLEFILRLLRLELTSVTFTKHLPCRKGYQFQVRPYKL